MCHDIWLERWLPLLIERAGDGPVLELGCGSGEDSAVLVAAGVSLVALDLSPRGLAAARERVPEARFVNQDLRDPFPLGGSSTGAVVASLSLHYFGWAETEALVQRIRDTLFAGGLLLCRLNSTRDHHYGAIGHPPIEEHFYSVGGEPKRFFDRQAVDRLFRNGWRVIGMEERVTHKYALPKTLWEIVLEKTA